MPLDLLSQFRTEFAGDPDNTEIADTDTLNLKRHRIFAQIRCRQFLRVVPVRKTERLFKGADHAAHFRIFEHKTFGIPFSTNHAENGGSAQIQAHLADCFPALFVVLRDHVSGGTGNEHTARARLGCHIVPENTGEVGRDPERALAGGSSRQRMSGKVADHVSRDRCSALILLPEKEQAQFVVPELSAEGDHGFPMGHEGRPVIHRHIAAIQIFIALHGVEGNGALDPVLRQ